MLKILTFSVLVLAIALTAPSVPSFAQEAGHENEGDNDGKSRYAIFQGVAGETPVTILVDGATGRTWMLAQSVSGGFSWVALTFEVATKNGLYAPPAPDEDGEGERDRDRD